MTLRNMECDNYELLPIRLHATIFSMVYFNMMVLHGNKDALGDKIKRKVPYNSGFIYILFNMGNI